MRCLTPAGIAGVAVYETSAEELSAGGASLRAPDGRERALAAACVPGLAVLCIDGQVVDEVLVSRVAGNVEIHAHGTVAVDAVLRARFRFDGFAPDPAVELLQRALSIEQFDFAAEQVGFRLAAESQRPANLVGLEYEAAMARWRERSRVAHAHFVARRVVLVGGTNVGKSSLFNRLVLRERSLAGPTPGLTRDPVREVTTLAGYPYEVVDTAGESLDALGALDRRAVAVGRSLQRDSIVVLVLDGSCADCEMHARRFRGVDLILAAKSDLGAPHWPSWVNPDLRVSARHEAADALRARLGELLRQHRGLPPAGPIAGPASLDAMSPDATC